MQKMDDFQIESITKSYMLLALNILTRFNTTKESYKERLTWFQSDLCCQILDAFNISREAYRRKLLPEEYTEGASGLQLEFDFS